MILKIFELLLLFFVPGALGFYLICLLGKDNKNNRLNILEFFSIGILTSIATNSIIASILALLKKFELSLLLNIILIFSILLLLAIILIKIKKHTSFKQIAIWNKETLIVALLILLSCTLFSQFGDNTVSNQDNHLNFAIASTILEHKSIGYYDKDILELPQQFRHFFSSGFNYLSADIDTGKVNPSALHLLHVWIAALLGIGGLGLANYTSSIFGVISILTIFFFVKRLTNLKIAVFSTALLTFSFVQIWFSNISGTEILFQVLLFGGLFIYLLFLKTHSKFYALLSGCLWGLLFITRIDSLLILLPLFLGIIVLYLSKIKTSKRNYGFFYLSITTLFLYSLLFNYSTSKGYVSMYLHAKDLPIHTFLIGVSIFLLILVILHMLNKKGSLNIYNLIKSKGDIFRKIILFLFITILIYLSITSSLEPSKYTARNMLMLSWYLSLPVYILGLIGIAYLLYKKLLSEKYFLPLFIFLTFFFFYSINLHNRNVQPWAMRRFIVTIPFLYLGFVYLLYQLRKKFTAKTVIPSLIVLGIILTVNITSPLLPFKEYQGAYSQTKNIFTEFSKDDALILVNWRDNRFAFPVKFFLDKKIYSISRSFSNQANVYNNEINLANFEQVLESLLSNNQRVFIINPEENMINALANSFNIEIYKEENINCSAFQITYNELPVRFINQSIPINIHQIKTKI